MKHSLLTVILSTLLFAAPVFAAGELFEQPTLYEDGLSHEFLFCADLDNDGDEDLVDGSVAVMLNNGDGTFADTVKYDVLASPYQVTGGDFDGDGYIDLAIPHAVLTASKNIKILMNNGDGTFSSGFTYYAHGSPRFAFAADLNGDSLCDIAVAGLGRDSTSVLYGNGDGTFGSAQYWTGGGWSINGADFGNDGDIDLVGTNDNEVSVFRNNGSGIFYRLTYSSGAGQTTVADLDGDGNIDIATADAYTDSVSVLLGTGDCTFASEHRYFVGSAGGKLSAADLDGDGYCDLAVTSKASPYQLVVLYNSGDGTFGEPTVHAPGCGVAVADFDDDGDIDVATSMSYGQGLCVFSNRGDGTLAAGTGYEVGERAGRNIWGGDLNGDGTADLAIANNYTGSDGTTGGVFVLLGDGDGSFAEAVEYPTGYYSKYVVGADFDGNASVDLAISNGHDFSVLLNNGDGTFGDSTHYAAGYDPEYGFADDVDGDGDNDLVLALMDEACVGVMLNNGDGTFATTLTYAAGNSPETMCPLDFDNNGSTDLAVCYYSAISVMSNNGDGTFGTATVLPTTSRARSVFAGDIDGDGYSDLIVSNRGRDSVAVYVNNGDSTFAIPVLYPSDGTVSAMDVDDDSDLDLVGKFTTYFGVMLNDGSGNFGPVDPYNFAASTAFVGADVDNDGDLDLAVRGSTVFVHINSTYEAETGCCGAYTSGYTGNCNCSTDGKLTLSDITTLIDHVYINKTPLCCHANGNTNGSSDCKLTLSDITTLIDTIYINKNPTELCMSECET